MFSIIRNRQKYVTSVSLYLGASLIPMLLSLAINPLIAKNMSPTDYAISGYYLSFSNLITPIITFYMIHYYIKEYFKRDENQRKHLLVIISKALIWFSGAVSILCFACFYIYFRYLDTTFAFPISPYLALMIFAIPLTGLLNLKLAEFRMQKKAKSYFIIAFFNGLIITICNLSFVVFIKLGAFGKLLAPFIANLIMFCYMVYKYQHCLLIHSSFSDFKSIFKFCWPLALSAMLGYFTNGFSTTYLESVGETTEYGIYIVGAQIGLYLSVFQVAISNTFQPDIYESVIKCNWNRFAKFSILQIALISTIALVFIVVAPFFIEILTAGRYIASTKYAQIVCLSTISSAIYFLINNFCIATNRQNLYLTTTIIGSIAIIFLMPILVKHWSFYGGAWMNVISYLLFSIINLILLGLVKFKRTKND